MPRNKSGIGGRKKQAKHKSQKRGHAIVVADTPDRAVSVLVPTAAAVATPMSPMKGANLDVPLLPQSPLRNLNLGRTPPAGSHGGAAVGGTLSILAGVNTIRKSNTNSGSGSTGLTGNVTAGSGDIESTRASVVAAVVAARRS